MNVKELRRKLELGFRAIQRDTTTSIKDHLSKRGNIAKDRDLLDLLWEFLCGTSAFASAACGEAVVGLVRNGSLEWDRALNEVLMRQKTAPREGMPYVVGLVAKLLMLHVESRSDNPGEEYICPFGLKTRRPHPFITITAARPDAWPEILRQLQSMLEKSSRPQHALDVRTLTLRMLQPFICYVFIETNLNPTGGTGLYQGIVNDIVLSAADSGKNNGSIHAYRAALIDIYESILDLLPIIPGDLGVTQMLLFKGMVSSVSLRGMEAQKKRIVYRLLNQMLDWRRICGTVSPFLPYLRTLIMEIGVELKDCAVSCPLYASIAYCLLNVAEYQEEGAKLVELLLHIIRSVDVDNPAIQIVLPVATLALLHGVSESSKDATRRKCHDILTILERSSFRKSVEALSSEPVEIIECAGLGITGVFAVLVSHLNSLLKQASITHLVSSIPGLSAMCYSSLVFRPVEDLQALTAMVSISIGSPADAIACLPFLLYVLKNDPSPAVQLHILLHAIPHLTSANDAFVTSRVVRIAQSLIGNGAEPNAGALASVGIRMLLNIWQIQPRVWPQFKGYLVTWVKRRRYGRPHDWSSGREWKDEFDMEVAVAASMRDACSFNAQDCGEDLLPLLFSILQAPDLHLSTVSFALQAINICIEADITDPRAAWNVFMNQFAIKTGGPNAPPETLNQLCGFYRLVGIKNDQSETYVTFKLEILASYLYPLIKHNNLDVRDAAYRSLAEFPLPDLFPLLPAPRELVASLVTQENPPAAATCLLAHIIRHECKHMRRAVFKGLAAVAGARIGGNIDKTANDQLGKVSQDIILDIRSTWEAGRTVAGVRSGLAAFTLLNAPTKATGPQPTAELSLPKLPFYRSLTSALRDISLADHVVLRLEAIPVWTKFWESALLFTYNQALSKAKEDTAPVPGSSLRRIQELENIVVSASSDLLDKRLQESRLPSLSVNILLSLAGLLLAASSLGLSVAQDQASHAVDVLLQNYVFHAAEPGSEEIALNDDERNDDIQFAVKMALTHMIKALHPNDEQRIKAISDALFDGVSQAKNNGQEWHLFACSYGLPVALQHLVLGAASAEGTSVFSRIKSLWVEEAEDVKVKRGLLIGFAMVLPSLRDAPDDIVTGIQEIVGLGAKTLQDLTTESASRSQADVPIIQGSTWIVSAAAVTGWVNFEENVEQLVRNTLQTVASQRSLETLYADTLAAYARIIHAVAADSPDAVTTQLNDLLQSACAASIPSYSRVAALLSIGPLLGIDWIPNLAESSSHTDPILVRRTIDTLRGLALGQEPKVSRVAAWVLGKIVSEISDEDQTRKTLIGAAGEITAGKRDPSNYNRLHVASSFLRAIFDTLTGLNGVKPSLEGYKVLLASLTAVDSALPPVDWSSVLSMLISLDGPVGKQESFASGCFLFASRHASASSAKSLVDFFVSMLTQTTASLGTIPGGWAEAIVSPDGVGKLLELGGLRPELSTLSKDAQAQDGHAAAAHASIAIAPTKVLEIFKELVRAVFGGEKDSGLDEAMQRQFLETVRTYLCANIDQSVSGSTVFLRLDLLKVLIEAYRTLSQNVHSEDMIVTVRSIIMCIAEDMGAVMELVSGFTEMKDPQRCGRTSKYLWAIGCLAELAASERPWLAEALAQITSQTSWEAALVRVTRDGLLHDKDTVRRSAIGSLLTAVVNIVPRSHSVERLQWIVRMLDVMIMLCAAGGSDGNTRAAGIAIELAWGKGAAGLIRSSLSAGFNRGQDNDADTNEVSDIIRVTDDPTWETAEYEMVELLPRILWGQDAVETTRKQIIKRMIRVLECTTAAISLDHGRKTAKQKELRIQISPRCRNGIREVLLRLRNGLDGELVQEGWEEVWETK